TCARWGMVPGDQEPAETGRPGWWGTTLDHAGDHPRVWAGAARGARGTARREAAARRILHGPGRGSGAAVDGSAAGEMAGAVRAGARQHAGGAAMGKSRRRGRSQ